GKDMEGMNKGRTKKKSSRPMAQAPVSIQAFLKEGAAKVGKSTLVLTILDPVTGKSLEKLNISAKVFMTSMDMGTDRPKVEELGKGRYQVKVAFGMAGPWRVELNITWPGKKPFVKDLDFEVHMPQ
ncbi:MAG TPA: FixH family protein, partial [bacterium]|nr:FixH family protein [bacterium]